MMVMSLVQPVGLCGHDLWVALTVMGAQLVFQRLWLGAFTKPLFW